MKDYLDLLKNITNIFGILFAGLFLLLIFPDTLYEYWIYIHSFLLIIMMIVIVKYIYATYDLYTILRGSSLMELLIIEKCRTSNMQALFVNEDDALIKHMQALVIRGIFFTPDPKIMKTDVYVMYIGIYELLHTVFSRKLLNRAIERKTSDRVDEVLNHLDSYLVDTKIDNLLNPKN